MGQQAGNSLYQTQMAIWGLNQRLPATGQGTQLSEAPPNSVQIPKKNSWNGPLLLTLQEKWPTGDPKSAQIHWERAAKNSQCEAITMGTKQRKQQTG